MSALPVIFVDTFTSSTSYFKQSRSSSWCKGLCFVLVFKHVQDNSSIVIVTHATCYWLSRFRYVENLSQEKHICISHNLVCGEDCPEICKFDIVFLFRLFIKWKLTCCKSPWSILGWPFSVWLRSLEKWLTSFWFVLGRCWWIRVGDGREICYEVSVSFICVCLRKWIACWIWGLAWECVW